MASADAENFRLAVLNPGGRDHEQHFGENRSATANEHAPVKPSGSPVDVRRAIPIARPTPQASEPEVRRAKPVDEDESN